MLPIDHQWGYNPTSFPGSLFSVSIVVETMEAEKRDPGNEVGYNLVSEVLSNLGTVR